MPTRSGEHVAQCQHQGGLRKGPVTTATGCPAPSGGGDASSSGLKNPRSPLGRTAWPCPSLKETLELSLLGAEEARDPRLT